MFQVIMELLLAYLANLKFLYQVEIYSKTIRKS